MLSRQPLEVRNGIPRYVLSGGYAESFGEQWNRWRRVQLDSATGRPISRTRLFEGTRWPERLDGERVLEIGCGAGRFTEILLEAGAEVWAVDATSAVDAVHANLGDHPRLQLAQADLFDLPFTKGAFDRVLCYGVLQCTPDPRAAFLCVCEYARPGGWIGADTYRKQPFVDRWSAKRLWRPVTTRMPPERLRRLVEWYVSRWLPIDTRLARAPKVGRFLTAIVPCWNYTGLYDLDREQLLDWAVLDTFDALSPRYDHPAELSSVLEWCAAAELADVDVRYGGNGILINARSGSPVQAEARH